MFNAIVPDHLLNPTGVFQGAVESIDAVNFETNQVRTKDPRTSAAGSKNAGMKSTRRQISMSN